MALPRRGGGALKDRTLPLERGPLSDLQHEHIIEIPVMVKEEGKALNKHTPLSLLKRYFGMLSFGSFDSFARPPKMMAF